MHDLSLYLLDMLENSVRAGATAVDRDDRRRPRRRRAHDRRRRRRAGPAVSPSRPSTRSSPPSRQEDRPRPQPLPPGRRGRRRRAQLGRSARARRRRDRGRHEPRARRPPPLGDVAADRRRWSPPTRRPSSPSRSAPAPTLPSAAPSCRRRPRGRALRGHAAPRADATAARRTLAVTAQPIDRHSRPQPTCEATDQQWTDTVDLRSREGAWDD